MQNQVVNIQGHRGARGLYPENTLTAFIEAIKLGVKTLELDVVISADKQVVVSHEAWMNSHFCSMPEGTPVQPSAEKKLNLFQMPYSEIKRYDCGKRGNSEFPEQKAIPEHKPLLSEVILKADEFTQNNNLNPVLFNLEIKSEDNPGVFNPSPEVFVDLIYQEILKYDLKTRVTVQSFDVTMLQQMKKIDASIQTGLLVENKDSIEMNLDRLGFIPDFYNPEFVLVNRALIDTVRQKNMKLNTWTVNELADMQRLVLMGVDGIITDFPERAIKLLNI